MLTQPALLPHFTISTTAPGSLVINKTAYICDQTALACKYIYPPCCDLILYVTFVGWTYRGKGESGEAVVTQQQL